MRQSFLARYAYIRYTERPGYRWYLATTAAFTVDLMAKPILVTFPFTQLLFDVWPLRRALIAGASLEITRGREPFSGTLESHHARADGLYLAGGDGCRLWR